MTGAEPRTDHRPLTGRRVVVCRAGTDAGPLVDALTALGAEAVLVPLVERAAPADGGAALRAAVAQINRYDWVAVTSAAGAEALLRAISDVGGPFPAPGVRVPGGEGSSSGISDVAGPIPAPGVRVPGGRWPPGVRVAAVGPATAAALRRGGVEPSLVPVTATAADLAAAFPPAPTPLLSSTPAATSGESAGRERRVLAPLAELAGDDLVDGLRARGWAVDRVDAYRLVDPAPGDPESGGGPDDPAGADAVAFTSPSIVDRFCLRFGSAAVPPVAVCIGPRTAERARQQGLDGLVTAAEHTAEGLVAALTAALADPER